MVLRATDTGNGGVIGLSGTIHIIGGISLVAPVASEDVPVTPKTYDIRYTTTGTISCKCGELKCRTV